jgi:hypothetical protein
MLHSLQAIMLCGWLYRLTSDPVFPFMDKPIIPVFQKPHVLFLQN